MKTKELIKAVEAISTEYKGVVSKAGGVVLFYRRAEVIATVRLKEIGMVNTIHDMFELLDNENRKKIMLFLVEYAFTPISEREEEKKYYIKIKKIIEKESYLNIYMTLNELFFADKHERHGYKTKFTWNEIKKFGLQKFANSELFELVEVTDNE